MTDPAVTVGARQVGDDSGRFWRELQASLTRPNIPALDGLRAIGVMLVILYHCDVPYVNGALGVEMFFVLSGFLITWLLLREYDRDGSVSLRAFYLRRSLRIFPAFYAFFAFALALELAHGRKPPFGEVASVFGYVGNYYSALVHPKDAFLAQTWSLAIEEQFYLLWPAVFLFLVARKRNLEGALLAVIGCEWIYRVGLQAAGVNQTYIYHAFDARLDHLMVGCLLAVLLHARSWEAVWRAVCASQALAVVSIGLLTLSALVDLRWVAYRNTVGFAVEPVIVAVLIVQLITFHRRVLWSWIQWPVVRFMGRISYSLYLYQQLTLSVPDRWFGSSPTPAKVLVAMAITVAFGCASYYGIEQPFMRLKNRLQGERARILTVPAAARTAEAV